MRTGNRRLSSTDRTSIRVRDFSLLYLESWDHRITVCENRVFHCFNWKRRGRVLVRHNKLNRKTCCTVYCCVRYKWFTVSSILT